MVFVVVLHWLQELAANALLAAPQALADTRAGGLQVVLLLRDAQLCADINESHCNTKYLKVRVAFVLGLYYLCVWRGEGGAGGGVCGNLAPLKCLGWCTATPARALSSAVHPVWK